MIPRIGVDLEPGVQIARVLPDLDLVDCAYGATRGGARAIVVPVAAFVGSASYTADLFSRPGLPPLIIKSEVDDMDRIPGLGSAPDRVLITGDRGRPLTDLSRGSDMMGRLLAGGQELALLVEPEVAMLKEVSRAKAHWVYFGTDTAHHSASLDSASAEFARLQSAALAAHKLGLRVGFYGPTGRQLPSVFHRIEVLEEVIPTPDLWSAALRLGWESAVREYRDLMV